MSTQPARGMRDFLPEDVRRREYVVGIIRGVYDRYGFEPLETPAVENIETLLGKYGDEGNKLIFKILKRGEHEASGAGRSRAALRPDRAAGARGRRVSGEAAEVLQALSDSARVAGRSPGARPLPRVLSVRHRRHRLDVAGRGSRTDRGRVRDSDDARVRRFRDSPQPPQVHCRVAELGYRCRPSATRDVLVAHRQGRQDRQGRRCEGAGREGFQRRRRSRASAAWIGRASTRRSGSIRWRARFSARRKTPASRTCARSSG